MSKSRTPVQLGFFGESQKLKSKTKAVDSFMPNSGEYLYSGFSFGGGVQSTALWLLIKYQPERLIKAVGHLPRQAYFADTQDEPAAVYEHIQFLIQNHPSIPLSNFSEMSIDSELGRTFPPYFVELENGEEGMIHRQCTERLKIGPVQRRFEVDVRSHLGLDAEERLPDRSVALWMGISIDEATRMRTNPKRWIQNVYPLIALGMDRASCFNLCLEYGIRPPKSACRRCPYRQDWVGFKRDYPEDFAIAVEVDRQLRISAPKGLLRPAYLHRSLQPLDVAVEQMERQGILPVAFDDGMQNECVGMCGV